VIVGAAAAVGYYARASYFVGVDNGQVTIFKGRSGGLLWFHPTIEQHTTLSLADVPPTRLDDVKAGKEVASVAAARRYVANLKAEHDELTGAAGAETATTTTTTTATVVP
jgi:hypothetical protein